MKYSSFRLRIHSPSGLIPLRALSIATMKILDILILIDKQISGGDITTGWAIKNLKMKSPAELQIVPYKPKDESNTNLIVESSIKGINTLLKRAQKPKYFTTQALEKARELANIIDNKNIDDISLHNGSQSIELTHKLVAHVDSLVYRIKEKPMGGIEGRLDMINIHSGLQLGIYRLIDDRQVKALFEEGDAMRELAKKLLGKKVYAMGEVKRNKAGEPTAITVKELEEIPDDKDRPTLLDIYGIDPDFTDGLSVDEFLRKQRDE